ncbi:hypothetical protein [Dokdonella immobilis]|uniref:hypothetical protein n=1 Tax=Dokdonella immobilis TaxID=578942 RepID=UPI001FE93112|nr:hypothetical protein [Dokdonella immobilis]
MGTAPIGVETSLVAKPVRVRPFGPGLGLAERKGLDLANHRDAVDRDREDSAIGAVGIADDGATRQRSCINAACAVLVVIRGFHQRFRTVAQGLAAFEQATVAVIGETQGSGPVAEADQATARAFPADQDVVVAKGLE